jgi:hypothetical protein
MAPLTKTYWLFRPHCHEARPVKVLSRMQRLVPADPRSSRSIDPETVWRCDHVVHASEDSV